MLFCPTPAFSELHQARTWQRFYNSPEKNNSENHVEVFSFLFLTVEVPCNLSLSFPLKMIMALIFRPPLLLFSGH